MGQGVVDGLGFGTFEGQVGGGGRRLEEEEGVGRRLPRCLQEVKEGEREVEVGLLARWEG